MDMGQQDLRVDVRALRAVADEFDAVADSVSGLARSPLRFGGALAGRAHVADGAAWRQGVDALLAVSAQWSRASAEIAVSLRDGADRYSGTDLLAAASLG
jgi:hypothetical protein